MASVYHIRDERSIVNVVTSDVKRPWGVLQQHREAHLLLQDGSIADDIISNERVEIRQERVPRIPAGEMP